MALFRKDRKAQLGVHSLKPALLISQMLKITIALSITNAAIAL